MEDMWNEANLLKEAKKQAEERIEDAEHVRDLLQAENDAVSTFIHTNIL